MRRLIDALLDLREPMMQYGSCPVHVQKDSALAQPFRFLHLPPEIRNQIASLVLTSDDEIRIRQPRFNRHPAPSPEPMFPQHPRLDFPLPRTPPPTPPGEDEGIIRQRVASREKDGHSRLALLMTCRQIYSDHWTIYYSRNTFSFTPSTWPAFNAAIPERCLTQLRHIRVRMPYHSRHIQIWRALGELDNLEIVDVVLAPPGNATKLERVNCVQGVRFCEKLRRIVIEREGIGEGLGPLVDEKERMEISEDKKVEKSINKDLVARWRSRKKRCQLEQCHETGKERRSTARAESLTREEKRARWHHANPDERAMDLYISIVQADEESGS